MRFSTLLLCVLLLACVAYGQEPANNSVSQPTASQGSLYQPVVQQTEVRPNSALTSGVMLEMTAPIPVVQHPTPSQYSANEPSKPAIRTPQQPNVTAPAATAVRK